MDDVQRNLHLLKVLGDKSLNPKIKETICSKAPNCLIFVLCSCALNTLNGVCPLKSNQIQELKKYKKFIHKLAYLKDSVAAKRAFLVKQAHKKNFGGLIPLLYVLLPPLEQQCHLLNE